MRTSKRSRSKVKPVSKKNPAKKVKVIVKTNLFRDQQVSPSPHVVHITTKNTIREGRKYLILNKKGQKSRPPPEVDVKTEPPDDQVLEETKACVSDESYADGSKASNEEGTTKCELEESEYQEIDDCTLLEESDMNKLNEIMATVPKESDGSEFKCPKCSKGFKRRGALKRHLFSHFPTKKLSCKFCNKMFTRKDSLRLHLKAHDGIVRQVNKSHKCEICGKGFLGPSQVAVHLRSHTGERPYTCEICKKSFRRIDNLRIHTRLHTGERDFQCEECGKSFAERIAVKRHMLVHTGEKPFACPHCDMRFRKNANLKAHIFFHTGENGFECKDCGKVFSRKAHLQMHCRSVHEKYRPFVCEKCGKTFSRKSEFELHFITHTGERPYKCSTCDKSFSTNYKLKVHMLTHVKEPPTCCPECGRKFTHKSRYMNHLHAKHSDLVKEALQGSKDSDSSDPETDDLQCNIELLLRLLLNDDALNELGWPEKPIDQVLEALLSNCGCKPCDDKLQSQCYRMRANAKLLLTNVINDDDIKLLLNDYTIDEVILEVLKLGNK